MPSISDTQLDILLSKAENLRDKIILCLLFDSGMRLSELANIKHSDIDFDTQTVLIIGKGNKQRKAPFTQETSKLLTQYLGTNHSEGNIWGINKYGIQKMLKRLKIETGIKCNPHSFRRGFACQLHKKGLSTLDIMHLGGWSDLGMVLRYTQSITFDDCLVHYHKVMSE